MMIRLISITCLYFCAISVVDGNHSFNRQLYPFGINRGLHLSRGGVGESKTSIQDTSDDYERAEKALLASIEKAESFIEKAIVKEVDTLFNIEHPHKEQVVSKAKKAVAEGVNKVKLTVKGHTEKGLYPFESKPHQASTDDKVHKDHRILHAIEAAERAVIHAIENEVDVLFHENDHGKNHSVAKAKTTVKDGVTKATKTIEKVHQDRRSWLHTVSSAMIEDYSVPEFFLE